jgi:hypothetical protein
MIHARIKFGSVNIGEQGCIGFDSLVRPIYLSLNIYFSFFHLLIKK